MRLSLPRGLSVNVAAPCIIKELIASNGVAQVGKIINVQCIMTIHEMGNSIG